MELPIHSAALATLAFLLSSCQTPSQSTRAELNARVLQDSAETPVGFRLIDGLQVGVPEGVGWKVLTQEQEAILFGKKTGPGASIAAAAELLQTSRIDAESPEKFVEYVRSNLFLEFRKKGEITGFTNVPGPFLGEYCAQSSISLKVKKADDTRANEFYVEQWYIFMCLHPDNKSRLYRISYSERAKEGDQAAALKADASSFFGGVHFVKPFTYKPRP